MNAAVLLGLAVLCALALVALFLMLSNKGGSGTAAVASTGTSGGGGDYTGTLKGLVPSKFSLAGKTHYYQVPQGAKGTLVFLPGCARAATGFWPYSTQAPECNAFPEDVSHTKQALLAGYGILVPTPLNPNLCFTSENTQNLAPIIKQYFKLTGLGGKPLFLGGCSAGGGLAVRYQSHLRSNNVGIKFDGLLLECATSSSPLEGGKAPAGFPPTVWVCMERDTDSQQEARSYVEGLKRSGIGAAVVVSPRRRVTPTYVSDRLPTVTPTESRKVVDGLKSIGLVDADGNVTANPHDFDKSGTRASGWMAKLKKLVPSGRQFTLGTVRNSPIYQAVSVAYAQHDHIADYTTAALKFFESGGKASMPDLLQRHTVSVPASLRV